MGRKDKDVCRYQIKTKHRYVWTKRESTEEGSTLRELVDQVSLLTLQMSRAEAVSLAFWVFRSIQRKYCGSLIRSVSSFLTMFLFFCPLISLQQSPPQGFEAYNGTAESSRLLLSQILIATLLDACNPTETFRFIPPAELEDWIWKISISRKKWKQSYYPMSASVFHKLALRVNRRLSALI